MSAKYPVPLHACRVWTEGHQLFLDFNGHAVQISLDKCSIECGPSNSPLARQLGWSTLLTILRDRERAGVAPSIGQHGAPVQHNVEAMVKEFKAKRTTKIGGIEFDNAELLAFLRKEGLV
jgi:hypothetical protein